MMVKDYLCEKLAKMRGVNDRAMVIVLAFYGVLICVYALQCD